MAKIQDAARYILEALAPEKTGERITAWKLQKLVYYSQAWSLVWDESCLFDDRIEAWADGPVCPALYKLHKGRLNLYAGDIEGDSSALTSSEKETIDAVLKHYGKKSGRYLSDLTHMERPWEESRKGLPAGSKSNTEITKELMAEFYGGL